MFKSPNQVSDDSIDVNKLNPIPKLRSFVESEKFKKFQADSKMFVTNLPAKTVELGEKSAKWVGDLRVKYESGELQTNLKQTLTKTKEEAAGYSRKAMSGELLRDAKESVLTGYNIALNRMRPAIDVIKSHVELHNDTILLFGSADSLSIENVILGDLFQTKPSASLNNYLESSAPNLAGKKIYNALNASNESKSLLLNDVSKHKMDRVIFFEPLPLLKSKSSLEENLGHLSLTFAGQLSSLIQFVFVTDTIEIDSAESEESFRINMFTILHTEYASFRALNISKHKLLIMCNNAKYNNLSQLKSKLFS